MIQVEHLVKRYGERSAVDDLSFTVERGKIYGFLGPNGAGKSTSMNVMTGYLAADGGKVLIDGHDILRDAIAAKACMGYLPEQPPLYGDMTVQEYLLFAAELKKVAKRERAKQTEALLERLSLGEVKDRLIKNLSKGFCQRVGLAQALLGDPKVLILDEPMVGLDPKQIMEMRDLIRGLAGAHTVLLSSHILSEISAVCDHILILSEGKLVAGGSPEELQEKMEGGAALTVTVLGEQERAEAAIAGIPGVERITCAAGEEEGSVLLCLTLQKNMDVRREVSVALTAAGIPVLSMQREETSLEDIFLKLTAAGSGEEEGESGRENKTAAETEPREETEAEMEKESDGEKKAAIGTEAAPEKESGDEKKAAVGTEPERPAENRKEMEGESAHREEGQADESNL